MPRAPGAGPRAGGPRAGGPRAWGPRAWGPRAWGRAPGVARRVSLSRRRSRVAAAVAVAAEAA
ncbi:MAG: hypothetical protein QOJ35_650, partial [Solirubrobacteraceae bacterium]|nr:hypothetical protein [Solirubrobacteraceae bacterium]